MMNVDVGDLFFVQHRGQTGSEPGMDQRSQASRRGFSASDRTANKLRDRSELADTQPRGSQRDAKFNWKNVVSFGGEPFAIGRDGMQTPEAARQNRAASSPQLRDFFPYVGFEFLWKSVYKIRNGHETTSQLGGGLL